jgi:DEAD/DEAH box helicase domain-containing protein
MIGVVSAPAPEKAAAKLFHKKFTEKKEITKLSPLEIRIKDLGAGSDSHFRVWIEISENVEDTDNEKDGKKTVKRLIVRKVS